MPAKFVGACTKRSSDSNGLGSLCSDVFFLDFIPKHFARRIKRCVVFFFSKNFACDTASGESRLKFRDTETGNGESLKFQGNFDYSLRASQPVFTIYPVYCVLWHCFKWGQKKSVVLGVLTIEASGFSAIDIR